MPGEPGSHMDTKFCHDIARIADALERIADSLKVRRDPDLPSVYAAEPRQELLGYAEQVLKALPDDFTTPEDIERYGEAIAAVKRGFADLERAVREKS